VLRCMQTIQRAQERSRPPVVSSRSAVNYMFTSEHLRIQIGLTEDLYILTAQPAEIEGRFGAEPVAFFYE